jgi:hypothetical protein
MKIVIIYLPNIPLSNTEIFFPCFLSKMVVDGAYHATEM